jgi:hypothetical protein|tara:strand:- start:330 stop:1025 length:696 start_codon:yes stop_codon:yes gene_type:complete
MALPILNTPKYPLELPSTGETIEFRPFLVKEQKVLLLAQQSNKKNMITQATLDIIKTCTFGKVTEKNPLFDLEYVFLNLRAKSVGETVDVLVTCPDDNKTKEKVKVNLESIDVQMPENHTNEINITDDVKMVMNYPTIKDIDMTGDKNTDVVFKTIKKCVREIHTEDKVMRQGDFTDKELDDFMDSFNSEQFERLMEFFNSMPKVRHEIEVKNSKTKKKSKVLLEGLDSFF